MSRRWRACAMSILVGCLALVCLPARAVDFVDKFVALPFTSYGDMLVDSAHRQVFVTGGYGSNEIAVVALDGSGVSLIPNAPGATALSMTADGRTVYATLRNGDGIAEIDTATLAMRRISTGAGSCPTQVAAVAGYVWFVESGDDCNQWAAIRRLDPATGAVSSDIQRGSLYQPALRVVPGTTRFLYAEAGSSTADVGVYDVADGTLNLVGSHSIEGYLNNALRLTNDGEHLMIHRYSSLSFHRITDFAADGVSMLPSAGWPRAYAADEEVVVVAQRDSNTVEVLGRGSSARANTVTLGTGDAGEVVALDLVGDQMFAVTLGSGLRLYQVDRPAVPAPGLTVEVPVSPVVGDPMTVSGVLTNQGTVIPGAVVTVRQDGVVQPLGSATTDSNGRYSLEFVPEQAGTLRLVSSYAGDATAKAAAGHAEVRVQLRRVALTLAGPASAESDQEVRLSGTLFDGTDPLDGVVLRVDRRCSGSSTWEPLTAVLTDAGGTFAATDSPGSCAAYDYLVRYEGDDVHAAASASMATTVEGATTVELQTPPSVHVGDTVLLSGTVNSSDGPLANTPLVARVSTPWGWRSLGTLTTDSTGWFETTDVPTDAGAHCYLVGYAGDSEHDPASTQSCVGVTKWATSLTLVGPTSAELEERVILRGRLTTDGQPLVGVHLVLSRSDRYQGTVLLPDVVTGADGAFTISDVPPQGGDVTYAASYAGGVSRSAASTTWNVAVSRPTRTLALRTDRTIYRRGETAQVFVDLTTDSSRTVRVYAQEADRARTRIFSGTIPRTGLRLSHVMTHNTVFSAAIAEDGRALSASTLLERATQAALSTEALGSYGRSRRYELYRLTADPTFRTTVRPARDRGCVRFRVQRASSGDWRGVSQTACVSVADDSTATWRLTGTQPRGARYRVRPVLVRDSLNAHGTGNWVYFAFD
jgi:hypothetical protein